MSSPDLHPKLNNLRRSQRVCLSVPVIIVKAEPGKPAVSEETRTLIVSAHGALVLLGMTAKLGDALTLRHRKTQEELTCRVVNFGTEQSGKRETGVEFDEPNPRFWRIAFPPADWSPRGPDSKPPTPHTPGAKPPFRKPVSTAPEPAKTASNKAPGPAHR
jgi:hypothetical protein